MKGFKRKSVVALCFSWLAASIPESLLKFEVVY